MSTYLRSLILNEFNALYEIKKSLIEASIFFTKFFEIHFFLKIILNVII